MPIHKKSPPIIVPAAELKPGAVVALTMLGMPEDSVVTGVKMQSIEVSVQPPVEGAPVTYLMPADLAVQVVGTTITPASPEQLLATLEAFESGEPGPDTYQEAIEELRRRGFIEDVPQLSRKGKLALDMARQKQAEEIIT